MGSDEWRKERHIGREAKEKAFLDRVERLIELYEDNQAGPYYTNRETMRKLGKALGAFKRKRYELTKEDKDRLEAEAKFERDRKKRHQSSNK